MRAESIAPAPGTPRSVKRRIVIIVMIALAPVVASYAAYYFWTPERQVNYGKLYATPAPAIAGQRADGEAFALPDLRGFWAILTVSPAACDATCQANLYAGRQARTMQNAERDRVMRVWLVTDDAPLPQDVLAEHPDVMVVRAGPSVVAALPERTRGSYLIDPLGNLVLAWPDDPDIKAVARDLGRLLRASRIG
jgi:hypothetical protein